jgi:hypothetical protein
MAQKIDTKDRKLNRRQQKCPTKQAAMERKFNFSLPPAGYTFS